MKPSEYLSHFQLQDIGMPVFQILDAMQKIEDPRQRVPAALLAATIAVEVLEGEVNTALTATVRALVHARTQETEHYKALRDYLRNEL